MNGTSYLRLLPKDIMQLVCWFGGVPRLDYMFEHEYHVVCTYCLRLCEQNSSTFVAAEDSHKRVFAQIHGRATECKHLLLSSESQCSHTVKYARYCFWCNVCDDGEEEDRDENEDLHS